MAAVPVLPRPVLVAAGPVIGAATVVVALRGQDVPGAAIAFLALVAAGGLFRAGQLGSEVALAIGLGAVGVAAGVSLLDQSTAPEVALWAAGAVAAGEATGLAQRTRSVAVPDAEVVTVELAWSAGLVVATLAGGLVLVGAADLPGPDGLVGEVLALGAVIGLGALVAVTPPGRAALRSVLVRRPRPEPAPLRPWDGGRPGRRPEGV